MYFTSFDCRHAATDTSSKAVLSLYNPSTSSIWLEVRKVEISISSESATAAAIGYGVGRFSATAPHTGGSVATRVKRSSAQPDSGIVDANARRATTAVVTDPAGVGYEISAHILTIDADTAGPVTQTIEFDEPFIITEGEGFAITTVRACQVGQVVSGSVWWTERTQ